jgi:hypothetical protein
VAQDLPTEEGAPSIKVRPTKWDSNEPIQDEVVRRANAQPNSPFLPVTAHQATARKLAYGNGWELGSLRIRQPQLGPTDRRSAGTAAGVLHGTPVRCLAALRGHPCAAHPRWWSSRLQAATKATRQERTHG